MQNDQNPPVAGRRVHISMWWMLMCTFRRGSGGFGTFCMVAWAPGGGGGPGVRPRGGWRSRRGRRAAVGARGEGGGGGEQRVGALGEGGGGARWWRCGARRGRRRTAARPRRRRS